MLFLSPVLAFGGLLVALAGLLIVAERLLVTYGICKIDINSAERELEIEGGQTLLDALTDNEIFIPSACRRKGSCGYCKVIVISGGGPVLPTETPLLTRQEIRGGVRLACQVKVREDIRIQIPEEYLKVQLFAATVESTRYLTSDIEEIRLRLNEPPGISHCPVQYSRSRPHPRRARFFSAIPSARPRASRMLLNWLCGWSPGALPRRICTTCRLGMR
jgi:Na+-transporting NADH:ubiquinone oxidoreductase subunit F